MRALVASFGIAVGVVAYLAREPLGIALACGALLAGALWQEYEE